MPFAETVHREVVSQCLRGTYYTHIKVHEDKGGHRSSTPPPPSPLILFFLMILINPCLYHTLTVALENYLTFEHQNDPLKNLDYNNGIPFIFALRALLRFILGCYSSI